MALIRPNALNEDTAPEHGDVLVIDGASVRKSTIVDVVNAARPFASQGEAEAGTATDVGMNPLTTKQAIEALGLVPGDIGSTVQASDPVLDSLAGLNLSTGDILYATGSGTLVRLPAGDEENLLAIQSGVPAWRTVPLVMDSISTWGLLLPETRAIRSHWIAEGVAEPRSSLLPLMDHTITRLKEEGIWDRLDLLYLPIDDPRGTLVNWKDPSSFEGEAVNDPEFVSLRGFHGDPDNNARIDTGYNFSTAPQWSQSRASLGVFVMSHELPDNAAAVGQFAVDDRIRIIPRSEGGSLSARVNSTTSKSESVGTSFGHAVASLNGSDEIELYKDGEALGTSTAVTTEAPKDTELTLLHHLGDYAPHIVGAVHAGDYLGSAAVHEALYEILRDYHLELGSFDDFEPESEALFDALDIKPNYIRRVLINDTIKRLKDAGIWDKLEVLYVLAAAHHMQARMNWKNPGYQLGGQDNGGPEFFLQPSFVGDGVNSNDPPTLTEDEGYTGSGNDYLDSEFNHDTSPANAHTNNMAAAVWVLSDSALADDYPLGTGGGSASRMKINTRDASDNLQYRMNDDTDTTVAVADGSGFFAIDRPDSATKKAFRNGVKIDESSVASTGSRSASVTGLRADDDYSVRKIGLFLVAESLSEADHETMHEIFNLYMSAVGAV